MMVLSFRIKLNDMTDLLSSWEYSSEVFVIKTSVNKLTLRKE